MPDDPTVVKAPLDTGRLGLAVQPHGGLPGVAFLLTVVRQRAGRSRRRDVVASVSLSTAERDALITALGGTP